MLHFILFAALAQTPAEAARAFERGDYDECLSTLAAVERRSGPSPRTASMRAQASDALGRTRDTYEALRVYFALLGGRTPSNADAHRELVDMFSRVKSKLSDEYEQKDRELTEGELSDVTAREEAEAKQAEAWAADRKAKQERDAREARNRFIISEAVDAHREKQRR